MKKFLPILFLVFSPLAHAAPQQCMVRIFQSNCGTENSISSVTVPLQSGEATIPIPLADDRTQKLSVYSKGDTFDLHVHRTNQKRTDCGPFNTCDEPGQGISLNNSTIEVGGAISAQFVDFGGRCINVSCW